MIAFVAVNDVFVMRAWEEAQGAHGKVVMLSDGNGDLAAAVRRSSPSIVPYVVLQAPLRTFVFCHRVTCRDVSTPIGHRSTVMIVLCLRKCCCALYSTPFIYDQ